MHNTGYDKLEPRAFECILLGYIDGIKGYIRKVLARFSMDTTKVISIPMPLHIKLLTPISEEDMAYIEKVPCASAMESLVYYMVCTVNDISHVSRHMG